MKDRSSMLHPAMGLAVLLGGLLGGFNFAWVHQERFPIYGIALDVIALPALVGLIFYVRRLKTAQSDEFVVAKKRMAAQTGLIFGLVAFALTTPLPLIFPQLFHDLLFSGGAPDAYAYGRIVGMAPFAIGTVIGLVVNWAKYR